LLAAAVCAALLAGCTNLTSGIDPSGRQIFADPAAGPLGGYHEVPGPESLWEGAELLLYPRETVAPVGTEVVLVAGVRGRDQFLITNQRIEWTISAGSVGHFVDLAWGTPLDYLVGDFTRPRIIDATRAVGSTSRKYLRLTRGNADPGDDVEVLRGQTWISVTSPQEGTTYVTAFSPDVFSWDLHKQTATVHWVDAQWQLPAPAINPAGTSHTLTTTVMKQSNQAPCVGWIVRYQIVGGPPAGFKPDGESAVEVATDSQGRATAEIFQGEPVAGTNVIQIQVIRPGQLAGGNGKRLIVGCGSTTKTWSAPGLAVQLSGPAEAAPGSTVRYQLEVSNPGDLPVEDVAASIPLPAGLEYVESSPAAQREAGALRWQLDTLSPGQTEAVGVTFRTRSPGTVEICAEATGSQGLTARHCLTTRVSLPQVEVEIFGPQQVTVGQKATFEIRITNHSAHPLGGVVIRDSFDPGLEHAELASPIERDLEPSLAPGEARSIGVEFRVTRSGELCHTVELRLGGQVLATARGCLTGIEPAEAPPTEPEPPAPGLPSLPGPPTEEPEAPPTEEAPGPPPAAAPVALEFTGPEQSEVGQTVTLQMKVSNQGTEELTRLELVLDFAPNLQATMASPGFRFEGDDLVWTIDSLAPGATRQYLLQARCLVPAQRAANRARLFKDSQVLAEQEMAMTITAAPTVNGAGLVLRIFDQQDSVPVGQGVTYLIEVSNEGATADSRLRLTVTLPEELTLDRLRTSGPPVQPGYEPPEDNTVRFLEVERIEPGQKLTYRVRAVATKPGQRVVVRAELTSQGLPQPVTAEEDTLIFPQP